MDDKRIITLTTDFGYKDPFIGEMKGVILSINPSAAIVDIIHEIEPHDIEHAAFIIGTSHKYFPLGTIHVVVVDPGVGSERRAIAAEAGGHYFIGPDNGIFSYVLSSAKEPKAVHLTEEKYMLDRESPTFQGRDVFAPVAAWLSRGTKIDEFGSAIEDCRLFEIPLPTVEKDKITGRVIYIDRFGNAIANIKHSDLSVFGEKFAIEVKGMVVHPLKFYSQADDKDLHCLINSSGYLELFVNTGSASGEFSIRKGEKVEARSRKL